GHHRGEGPVGLALLYHGVDSLLILGRPRIGENAAVAERAGPVLGPSLRPAEHGAARKQSRALHDNIRRYGVLDELAPGRELLLNLARGTESRTHTGGSQSRLGELATCTLLRPGRFKLKGG